MTLIFKKGSPNFIYNLTQVCVIRLVEIVTRGRKHTEWAVMIHFSYVCQDEIELYRNVSIEESKKVRGLLLPHIGGDINAGLISLEELIRKNGIYPPHLMRS